MSLVGSDIYEQLTQSSELEMQAQSCFFLYYYKVSFGITFFGHFIPKDEIFTQNKRKKSELDLTPQKC